MSRLNRKPILIKILETLLGKLHRSATTFNEGPDTNSPIEPDQTGDSIQIITNRTLRETNLQALSISGRIIHLLNTNNVTSVKHLSLLSETDLLKLKHIGPKSIVEIKMAMGEHGLSLKEEKATDDAFAYLDDLADISGVRDT